EARRRVGVQIAGPLDLVEELRRDGPDRHEAAGPGGLGHDERAVGVHLREREPDAGDVRYLVEERVVAARALRAALEDVAGDDPGREAVPVVARPAELPRRGAEGERGVRHA